MEIRSFNQELQFADILFSRLFKNITIDKIVNGKKLSYNVQCIRANRSRIYKNLQNPTKQALYSYPLIVYQRNGITRDPERVSSLHNEIIRSANSRKPDFNLLAPNPITINYSVSLISNQESDNDLIMGNFIPFFNSDLFVTCKHPKFAGLTYNSQVTMEDAITEEHPEELANDSYDVTVTTFNFDFKTYIFGGNERVAAGKHTEYRTILSTDPNGNIVSVELSNLYVGYVPAINAVCVDFYAIPRYDTTNISDLVPYDFDKYFQDVETGKLSDPTYDSIHWVIDENGVFKNDNEFTKKLINS